MIYDSPHEHTVAYMNTACEGGHHFHIYSISENIYILWLNIISEFPFQPNIYMYSELLTKTHMNIANVIIIQWQQYVNKISSYIIKL